MGHDLSLLEMGKRRALRPETLASLVAQGPDLLPALLDAIHGGTRAQKSNLARVIERMRGVEAVPALLPLLEDADVRVRAAAMEALGKSGDRRALAPLVERLHANDPFLRNDAASALGDLGMPEAIPALHETLTALLEDPGDPQAVARLVAAEQARAADDWMYRVGRRLQVVIAVVTALAKLGDQAHAPLVLALMDFHFAEDAEAYPAARVREEAIYASVHVAAPGLLPALRAARRREPSGDAVIDFSLLTALFYLGLRASVDEFVACFAEGYPRGYPPAETLGRIAGLVGETPPAELAALEAWWQARREGFDPDVCYRWGRPLDVAVLVEHLPGELPIQTSMRFDELTVITGERFEPDYALPPEQQAEQRIARVRAWSAQHAQAFEPGSLYKHGHKQELAAVFGSTV